MNREVDELKAWKESYLQIESTWDCQRVGSEIGAKLGSNIREYILPWILTIKQRMAKLEKAMHEIEANRYDPIVILDILSAVQQIRDDKCKHTWEVGSPFYIDEELKIKAKCEICSEEFITKFGENYQKIINDEDFKKISCLDKKKK